MFLDDLINMLRNGRPKDNTLENGNKLPRGKRVFNSFIRVKPFPLTHNSRL